MDSAVGQKGEDQLELSPINDFLDKLEFKKSLTYQEVSLLSLTAQIKFSDEQSKFLQIS